MTQEMVLFQIRSSPFILVFKPSSQSASSHMRTEDHQMPKGCKTYVTNHFFMKTSSPADETSRSATYNAPHPSLFLAL